MSLPTTPHTLLTTDRRGLISVLLGAISLAGVLFMPVTRGNVGEYVVLAAAVLSIVEAVGAKRVLFRFVGAALATLTILMGVIALLFGH